MIKIPISRIIIITLIFCSLSQWCNAQIDWTTVPLTTIGDSTLASTANVIVTGKIYNKETGSIYNSNTRVCNTS